jgi:hypothetical protein
MFIAMFVFVFLFMLHEKKLGHGREHGHWTLGMEMDTRHGHEYVYIVKYLRRDLAANHKDFETKSWFFHQGMMTTI